MPTEEWGQSFLLHLKFRRQSTQVPAYAFLRPKKKVQKTLNVGLYKITLKEILKLDVLNMETILVTKIPALGKQMAGFLVQDHRCCTVRLKKQSILEVVLKC